MPHRLKILTIFMYVRHIISFLYITFIYNYPSETREKRNEYNRKVNINLWASPCLKHSTNDFHLAEKAMDFSRVHIGRYKYTVYLNRYDLFCIKFILITFKVGIRTIILFSYITHSN